nr:MAG TPA: hypothetical protein [Caudoviricetes sp.]
MNLLWSQLLIFYEGIEFIVGDFYSIFQKSLFC